MLKEQEDIILKIKTNLQIHHEIYPIKRIDIEKAIIDGKIYFLCKPCHYSIKTTTPQSL